MTLVTTKIESWMENCLTYEPVVTDYNYTQDDIFEKYFNNIQKSSDKLRSNYTLNHVKRMREYGYVWNNSKEDIVMMVGLQPFGFNIFRAGSRTYVDPNYRNQLFKSPDNLKVSTMHINLCKEDEFVFESREYNKSSLQWLKKSKPFVDWTIYSKKVELKFKNNWQWIMHRPTTLDVEQIISEISYNQ